MPLIDWKDSYSLGIPAVDHEHRELVEIINDLYDRLGAERVSDFLGEVLARITAHFALEEKVMREAAYPEYAAHKGDHERLLDDIRDIMDDYEDEERIDVEHFGRRLESWFSEHFRTFDARLHSGLHAELGASPRA